MSTVRRSTLTCLASIAVLAGFSLLASAPAWAGEALGVTGTFGSASSTPADPFPLSGPIGVAVSQSSEDVYVVDREAGLVEYFSASGVYEGQFNGGDNPGFPGGFSSPEGIAIDSSCYYNKLTEATTPTCAKTYPSNGDVYVMDSGHGVVDKLSATGSYISQLGPFPGQIVGVAVDGSGNVWVSEFFGNVSEYGDTGTLEQQFNPEERVRAGLAVDSADNVLSASSRRSSGEVQPRRRTAGRFGNRSDCPRGRAGGGSRDERSVCGLGRRLDRSVRRVR